MWKNLAIGAAALALLGASAVSAQTLRDRPPGDSASQAGQGRQGPSREDAAAYVEARIAGLHSGLQLTPDQERIWPAVEQAYRDYAKLRAERAAAGAPQADDDPVGRMQRRADRYNRRGAALKTLADALAPLWQSFDDGQKRRFAALTRPPNQRFGFGGPRTADGFGPRGRDGFGAGPRGGDRDEFDRGPRRFDFDGPRRGDRDGYDRGPRRFDFEGPRGGDREDYDRGPRRFGFEGPRGGDREDYDRGPRRFDFGGPRRGDRDDFDRGSRRFGFGGPRRGDRDDFDRGSRRFGFDRRDFGRDFGRDLRRDRRDLPWWHPDIGPGRRGFRSDNENGEDDQSGPAGDTADEGNI